jgi:hypothetical protein
MLCLIFKTAPHIVGELLTTAFRYRMLFVPNNPKIRRGTPSLTALVPLQRRPVGAIRK